MTLANAEFRCFVGGFHSCTDEKDLERAFSKFGDVTDSKVICNPVTGKSRNFGFVTFKEEKSMRDAIKEMNGRKLDGSRVDPKDVKFECFVGNLPDGTKENDLLRAFSLFGEVTGSEIVYDTETIKSRRFGFVTFKDEKSMRNAIVELDAIDELLDDVRTRVVTNGLKLDAARIIYGDEHIRWGISVKKSTRIFTRVITVKEAWPHKPSHAERLRSFMLDIIPLIGEKPSKAYP